MHSRQSLRFFLLTVMVTGLLACSGKVDQSALRAEIGSAPVVLLSTAWCGYCRKLRTSLNDWGVAFEEIDVEHKANGHRAYQLVNGRGVPILLIGDQQVHGYSPDKARELLVVAGLIPASTAD